MALPFQPRTEIGGAAVLPDDRGVLGFAGLPIPEDHRLPLVGDADPLDPDPLSRHGIPPRQGTGNRQRLAGDPDGDVADLLRVMLDPTGLREILREL